MGHEMTRVTAKGQLTIPVSIRKKLKIREGDYLLVRLEEEEIRLKKVEPIQPLSQEDPIWQLVGAGASGLSDVAENHDAAIRERLAWETLTSTLKETAGVFNPANYPEWETPSKVSAWVRDGRRKDEDRLVRKLGARTE